MAITCLLLQPGQNFTATPTTNSSTLEEDDSPSGACDEEALSMGDYRDILSLIRVLSHGPQSKTDVDGIIDLYVKPYQSKSLLNNLFFQASAKYR